MCAAGLCSEVNFFAEYAVFGDATQALYLQMKQRICRGICTKEELVL